MRSVSTKKSTVSYITKLRVQSSKTVYPSAVPIKIVLEAGLKFCAAATPT